MIAALALLTLAAGPDDKAVLQRAAAAETAHLKEAPDDTDSLYRLGLAYLALGDFKNAVVPLKTLVKKDPEAIDGKILLARALRLSGDAQEARTLLDTALLQHPDDASLHAERGL